MTCWLDGFTLRRDGQDSTESQTSHGIFSYFATCKTTKPRLATSRPREFQDRIAKRAKRSAWF